ncbi:3-deoxy-D-manno-octulosonic acid transferase [Nisaea acidiphila]|uniref:3-deoxy-D-manno-octulosonic acid transferase n=1 Tax=Nisaea acidiphila TaxID=1862145 RepID=A0A9J7AM59_9PROT|nr:3-deoxy-D-manno-octulosonic acid transferase [Nisaea acidiphila]UUX48238.1 3-deoxy-D-manno-octulosonic acid transferase [Nisaea acidiphila]
MIFHLYSGAMRLAAPILEGLLRKRLARGKEDPERVGERRGEASLARPAGRLFWVHGASVGECQAALALIERLLAKDPDLSILLTSGTLTSARLMQDRLPKRAMHQFVPLDQPAWIARFLDHWAPDAAIFVESDLWPNLVLSAAKRDIPLVLANARMSESSLERWRRLSAFTGRLFSEFALVLASNPEQKAGFESLTRSPVLWVGNLKRAAAPLAADPDKRAALRTAIGTRPVFLAASTHPGEEKAAAEAHRLAAAECQDLLTIIAPRHPTRGVEISDALTAAGFKCVRRSDGALPGTETEIYVADTLGEMGTLFDLSDAVFVAGSLVPVGGHNPLEPAHFGKPVLFGQLMAKNADIASDMIAAHAAREIADATDLGRRIRDLLRDDSARAELGANAKTFALGQGAIADEMAERIFAAVAERGARR